MEYIENMCKMTCKILKACILPIFIFLICINSISIYAAGDNVGAGHSEIDTEIVEKGEKVTYTFSLTNYESIDDGLYAIQGTLVYDEDVFGKLYAEDFKMQNGWESLQFNPETKEFVAIKRDGSKQPETIFEIVFTTQQDVDAQKTKIGVTGIETSEGKYDIQPEESLVEINVISNIKKPEVEQIPNGSSGEDSGQTQNQQGQQINGESYNENTSQSTNQTNTQQSTTNVDTSDHNLIIWYWVGIIVSLLIISMCVMKMRLQKLGYVFAKDGIAQKSIQVVKKRKNLSIIILVGLLTIASIQGIYANQRKGDLNNDNTIDLADVVLLQKHLIKLDQLNEKQQELADMNNNNKLTVTDLVLMLLKLEKKVDYEVTLKSETEKQQVEKNTDITLRFSAIVTNDKEIKQVEINGNLYDVTSMEGNMYGVTLPKETTVGLKTYSFTKVILSNDKSVKVDYSENIDVLKDVVRIENFVSEDIVKTVKKKVSFDVIDTDDALINAYLKILLHGTDTVKETHEVKKGSNYFELSLDEDEVYDAVIEYTYQRSENDSNTQETAAISKELSLNVDYQFNFGGLKLYNENYEEISSVSKNDKFYIGFKATTATDYKVDRVVIEGENYPVELKDNMYYVSLPVVNEAGSKSYKIESVVLENGTVFKLDKDNTLDVTVLKQKAKVKTLNAVETQDQLTITYEINDPDQTLSDMNLIVKDDAGNELSKQELSSNKGNVVLDVKDVFVQSYEIVIQVNSQLSESSEKEAITLSTKKQDAMKKVIIVSSSLNESVVEKGSNVQLSYEWKTNVKEEATNIVVNNLIIPVNKQDNKYIATYTTGKTAGVEQLELSQIQFGDQKITVANTQEVEVMKDAPTISGFATEEDYPNKKVDVRFIVSDPDQSFVSGKAVLLKDGNVEKEQTFTSAGEQIISFDVIEKEIYELKVYASYDRDINKTQSVKDKEIKSLSVQLLNHYELKLSNFETKNEEGTATKYFNKNEKINVSFIGDSASIYALSKVEVNGTVYELQKVKDNTYEFVMNGFDTAGEKDFTLTKIWFENSKEISVDKDNLFKVEVSKSKPTIESFVGSKNINDKLEASFVLKDDEKTITSATTKIVDGTGTELATSTQTSGEIKLESELTDSEEYKVIVTVTYAINTSGSVTEELLNEDLTASRDAIHIKDVKDTTLYKDGQEIDVLDVTSGVPQDVSSYYVKITSELNPDLYANVKEFRLKDKKLEVVVDQKDIMSRNDVNTRFGEFAFEISYTDDSGTHRPIADAKEFIDKINSDLSGTFELKEDIDASQLTSTSPLINGTFKGTLKGNGHKILNLNTTLFKEITGTIENVIIENANVTNSYDQIGILANKAYSSAKIQKVFIVDSTISNKNSQVGGFVGLLDGSAQILESAAINLTLKGDNTIGGLVGQSNKSTLIKNSYVTGEITGYQYGNNNGARVAGISGWHTGTIDSCIANVNIVNGDKKGNGGLVGGPSSSSSENPIIKNSFALTTGTAYRLAGFDKFTLSENLYEYSGSSATTNINDKNNTIIKEVTSLNDVSFYKDKLKLDENIWDFSLVGKSKLPTLKSDPTAKDELASEIEENKNDIASYELVRRHEAYQSDRDIAYYNMMKFMPFADTSIWVEQGNKVTGNMATKKISYILPMKSDQTLISGITQDTKESLTTLRIIYADGTKEEVKVTYKKTLGDIVSVYETNDHTVYQFPKYIGTIDSTWLDSVVSKASSYSYDTIQTVTTETETRIYSDYYKESVQPRVKEIITNLLISGDYPTYFAKGVVTQSWKQEFEKESNLLNALYAYNYYDKWYHLNYDGITLSDLMFFNGILISPKMTTNQLINDVLTTTEGNRKTSATNTFYDNVLKKYTGKDLMKYLGDFAVVLAGYDTPSDWFKAEFDGLLVEKPANNPNVTVNYRVWDIMTALTSYRKVILPILNAPSEDMYILTVPGQIMIGSMNAYPVYQKADGRDQMFTVIDTFGDRLSNLYGTTVALVPDGEKILNSFADLALDSKRVFDVEIPEKGINKGNQVIGETNDPVIKWVYEASGIYHEGYGVAAVAGGGIVYWLSGRQMDPGYYGVLTHETAHNQDGKYFLGGFGRRDYTGAESHADGMWTQGTGANDPVFNVSYVVDPTTELAKNFSYERINTLEKFESYFKGMFETSYVLDYLAAQAFLSLTPEQQAAVGAQVTENGTTSTTSTYSRLTADQFRKMNLKTVEDLWDNKIVMIGGDLTSPSTHASAQSGQYAGPNFYEMFWYSPHNDNGTPDNVSFKRMSQEMAGYAGYVNGYIKYASNYTKVKEGTQTPTDLTVLRSITGDSSMTWKKYKMNRFNTVKNNLANFTYFDTDKVIEEFKAAFIKDANTGNSTGSNSKSVKSYYYGIVKRATNEFETGNIYDKKNVTMITTAQQFIDVINSNVTGYYQLANDIDFSGVNVSGSYITNTFMGVLDGNGYKLLNVNATLFNNIIYGSIRNLVIDNPVYDGSTSAYIANSSTNLYIENVKVLDTDVQVPLVFKKSGSYSEYEVETTIKTFEIDSVEDFIAIGSSDINLKKQYKLTADIDFTDVQITNGYVVNGAFVGEIIGNGHTLTGLKTPLFKELQSAYVHDFVIKSANITTNGVTGILANSAKGSSVIENIDIVDSTLTNNGSQVGGFVGLLTNTSQVKNSAALNLTLQADNTIGGIAGQSDAGTIISNSMVTGNITGTQTYNNNGARVGGISGWGTGTIQSVFTKVNIRSNRILGNGGILGGPSSGSPKVTNSVANTTGTAYRLAGFNTLGAAQNVYEVTTSATTNVNTNNSAQVKEVDETQLNDPEFYRTTLGWSEEIWDFSNVSTTGIPTLK